MVVLPFYYQLMYIFLDFLNYSIIVTIIYFGGLKNKIKPLHKFFFFFLLNNRFTMDNDIENIINGDEMINNDIINTKKFESKAQFYSKLVLSFILIELV